MPAGSKTDPLLEKAEPVSDISSASVITLFNGGEGKEPAAQHQQLPEERSENM